MVRQHGDRASDPFEQRNRLEAERLVLDARLRDFEPVRNRILDAGGKPEAIRDLMLRRQNWTADQIARLRGETADPGAPLLDEHGHKADEIDPTAALISLPIRAGVFGAGLSDTVSFGYSGSVQMPRASERDSMVPGRAGTSGEIVTMQRRALGGVQFRGRLESKTSWLDFESWPDGPTLNLWSRSWAYLVPFPPPPVDSVLSYGVNVAVYLAADREQGEAQFLSAVGLGHSANLSTNTDIPLTASGGWPLNVDLSTPGPSFNGHCGTVFGKTQARRTLGIGAGQIPAIRMVLSVYGLIGDVAGQDAACKFSFNSDSLIRPEDDSGREGRISFHYRPLRPSAEM